MSLRLIAVLQIDSKGSKVALVNRALQGAMRSRDPELYIKPLLTSHATQGELEEALTLIKDAKEAQLAREASNGQASTSGNGCPSPSSHSNSLFCCFQDLKFQ